MICIVRLIWRGEQLTSIDSIRKIVDEYLVLDLDLQNRLAWQYMTRICKELYGGNDG